MFDQIFATLDGLSSDGVQLALVVVTLLSPCLVIGLTWFARWLLADNEQFVTVYGEARCPVRCLRRA